ncbi:hypothetical protein LTR47_010751 [Exophiala xenobiotica]|nr:hypothetical protein LTR41_002846 [Exophiala xenobiotica]KAK5218609.1 hypothetical protein LTR72_008548 [Exophiala xenobiotica]KAK5221637.1 hypothetical protein LTR47_010751 [Exophiala xenobiotica]KAK5252413.1 hypothetical protein LTS06_003050 [Exophiala xenobiotica]KAK5284153.1 hypothetical protein LTR40_000671 [Exophiala xenobiotica]
MKIQYACLLFLSARLTFGHDQRLLVHEDALHACNSLVDDFPGLVVFPHDPEYTSQQNQYWASNQADSHPNCRLVPRTSEDVSSLVSQLASLEREDDDDVKFAIASGGHHTAEGASNLDDGITLDLSGLDSIALDQRPDHASIEVGTGARWLDVYQYLEPRGVMVSGARVASVGVGGYLLGGGISIFASQHGWSGDVVEAIELVLANGTILQSNETHHAGLFAALKGGGSNFGIATKFRLKTFPAQQLHMALLAFSQEQIPLLLQELTTFARNAHVDPATSVDLSIGFDGATAQVVYVLMLTHLGPHPDESSLWRPFFEIPALSRSAQHDTSLTEMAEMMEFNNPPGFRQHKVTFTVHNDAVLLHQLAELFSSTMQNDSLHIDGYFRSGMLVQPLTLPHMHFAREHGRANFLGLDDEQDPLILLSIESRWLLRSHDEIYTTTLAKLLGQCEALATSKANPLLHPFRYINYAAAGQDAFALLRHQRRHGHGHKHQALEEARMLRRLYDPTGFFDRRLNNPFKI